MKLFLHLVTWLSGLVLLTGCGARIGPQMADGTFLNLNGEVVNAYPGPFDVTVQAGLQVLAAMRVAVGAKLDGSSETVILAAAPQGAPLKLRFIREGRGLTEVKVRTGTIGYWNQEFSFQFQALINDRLKRGKLSIPETFARLPESAARDDADPDPGEAEPALAAPVSRTDSAAPVKVEAERTKTKPPDRKTPVSSPPAPLAALPKPAPPPPDPDFTVYFETDSNLPGPDEWAKLDQVAMQLFAHPSWTLALVGFADGGENRGRPRMVAESRVLAVKFYLIGKGVDAGRLTTAGHRLNRSGNSAVIQERRRVDLRLIRVP